MYRVLRVVLPWFVMCAAVCGGALACASGPSAKASSANNSRMDTTDFRRPEFRTIYDAIKATRPDWLQPRGGPTSLTNASRQTPVVGVFIDGDSRGYGVDKLKELVGSDVSVIHHIAPSESLATYGPDWPWGGIVVTRRR